MEKLINPWTDIKEYNCFGCAPTNQSGLQMEFFVEGDEIVSFWSPSVDHQGWLNTLHGGIQCTLLDEIAAWVVLERLETCGMTSKMEMRFVKAVDITKGPITVRAKLREMKRNIAVIDAWITDQEGELCSKAELYYFTYPKAVAKEKFYFRPVK